MNFPHAGAMNLLLLLLINKVATYTWLQKKPIIVCKWRIKSSIDVSWRCDLISWGYFKRSGPFRVFQIGDMMNNEYKKHRYIERPQQVEIALPDKHKDGVQHIFLGAILNHSLVSLRWAKAAPSFSPCSDGKLRRSILQRTKITKIVRTSFKGSFPQVRSVERLRSVCGGWVLHSQM